MRACPRCGTNNLDGAAACVACGIALAAPAAGLKQTMLGMSPGMGTAQRAPVPAPAPSPGTAQALGRGTMLGMPSPLAGHPNPFGTPAAPPSGPIPPAPITQPGAAVAPNAPPTQPSGGAPQQRPGGLKQTMLGFAPNPAAAAPAGPAFGSAPTPLAPPAAYPQQQQQPQPAEPVGGSTVAFSQYGVPMPPAHPVDPAPQAVSAPPGVRVGSSPLHQQTMLGVARPGIAPRRPGQHVAQPAQPPQASAAQPRFEAREQTVALPNPTPITGVAPLPQLEAPRATPRADGSSSSSKKVGFPKGAIVLIAVAALLAVAAGVVAFLWEAPRPIRAEVVLDDRGTEGLALTCDDCADGTTVSIATNKATFSKKKALLALPKPLDVGKNDVRVAVRRPGIGRDEEVALPVTIDYRVRGDLSALDEDPPKVKVLVQATPGAVVVVDGKPVSLDPTGKGEHSVDVATELGGPSDTIVPFERKLGYAVTLPGGGVHQGDVTLRFGIVPLRVEAPGNGIVIEGETFMLSGHTLKDGRVTVSGRPITVDAEGRFAQLMNVSSIGETTIVVRAESKGDHAPRLVRVRVKRVASLKEAAVAFAKTATDDYATIADHGTKKGLPVVLEGEVVETRIDGNVTVLILDVKTGCAASPCLARVVYGGRYDAKKATQLGAYGSLLGSVDGPRTGAKIPEVAAEFLLPVPKTRK